MKRRKQKETARRIAILTIALVALLVAAGCTKKYNAVISNDSAQAGLVSEADEAIGIGGVEATSDDVEWRYTRTIPEPLYVETKEAALSLGDIDVNRVEVDIPENTFDTGTIVSLSNPESVPKLGSDALRPIDSPIELKAQGLNAYNPTRLNEPITVAMKLDKNQLHRNFDRGSVQIFYFNGEKWECFKPRKLDLDAGIITFNTFHLGVFGYGEIAKREQIRQYVHRKVLNGKVEIKSIDYELAIWKYAEVEAAFKALEYGSDGNFWGYLNSAKDFGAVWDQMRGIRVQLENEAILAGIEARKKEEEPVLNEQEMNGIRIEVREGIRKQFAYRTKSESEISKGESELSYLIDSYDNANLLEHGSFGYDTANDSLETRLDALLYLRDKILRDTRRNQIISSSITNENDLSIGDLIVLSQLWYTRDGRAQYLRYIKDEFEIDLSARR